MSNEAFHVGCEVETVSNVGSQVEKDYSEGTHSNRDSLE